jgi:di/tricarboxylate transporter/CRP-like cAMP-binding protein
MANAEAGSESRALNIEYADLLARVKLFSGMGRVTLAKLAARLESVPVPAGAVLFCEGDPGDAFFLTARGSFGAFVTSQTGDAQYRVNTLGPGDPFGELALLGDHPRTATIRADTDGEVLRLERVRFLALLREEPSVALAMAASLGERLRMRNAPAGVAARAAPTGAKPAAGAARASRRQRVTRAAVGGALAVLVLALGWSVSPPAALSVQGWHALVTTIAIIPVLATDALPDVISSLLLICGWVLAGIVSPSVALSGFSSPSWVLLVSVLIIGAAIASSGLPYRLALWTVQHSRGGFGGQVSALCVAGTLLSPAVPNSTARVTLVAPAIGELIEALGYAPRSRPAAGLAMATLTGCGQMVAPFLTSSTTAVLIFAVLPRAGDVELNFLTWAFYAAPANAILLAGMIAAVWLAYRPRTQAEAASRPNRETVELQRRLIGSPTRSERVSFVVAVALVSGFVTQPLHGLDPAWVGVFALAALGATRVVDGSALTGVNWNFVFLFGMLASLSSVFGATGVDRWLASSIGGVLGGLTAVPALFVAALALLTFATSFVLRWQAAAPLITVVAVPVAGAAGIHPFVVGLVALMASNVFFLPYQSTAYLALYHGTGGRLFTHTQARPAALAYAVIVLVAVCASVIPWMAMGLL